MRECIGKASKHFIVNISDLTSFSILYSVVWIYKETFRQTPPFGSVEQIVLPQPKGTTMEVELFYKDELRKFPLNAHLSFMTLVSLVHSKYPELLDRPFTLTCRVDDGEDNYISISSDEDLENAVRLNKNLVLHIAIDDTTTN